MKTKSYSVKMIYYFRCCAEQENQRHEGREGYNRMAGASANPLVLFYSVHRVC